MSASVVPACYDAMKSMDPAAPVASLSEDLVVVEAPSLPYGGTTKSRGEFFGKVVGYTGSGRHFGSRAQRSYRGPVTATGNRPTTRAETPPSGGQHLTTPRPTAGGG